MSGSSHLTEFQAPDGCRFTIELRTEDSRQASTILLNGIPHHLERIPRDILARSYHMDADPDYVPRCDAAGYCYVMVPYSV